MSPSSSEKNPADLAALDDDALIDAVQRQTFRYFWEGAHPVSGLAPDRCTRRDERGGNPVVSGGTGFGVMAIVAAVERGWISREAAVERVGRILRLLSHAPCYHGAFPHFLDGATGATIPFSRKDDGGDIVETSLLCMGLLCARQYFDADTESEARLRKQVNEICDGVEWTWYTQGGRPHLYWHWSPNNGWAMNHEIHGWNECLVTYVLAAGSRNYAIDPAIYDTGFAGGANYRDFQSWPLFFAHYSFCGLDPRGLQDRHASYWDLNVQHVRFHHRHCIANAKGHAGYGESCWGLTASDDPDGYDAHAPGNDNGTISPTAALASLPYAPREVLQMTRHLLTRYGGKVWGRYGFVDAFNERRNWFADTYLAIDQGPIVAMMENHRSQLLWNLFMRAPEVRDGLARLRFTSPHLR